MMPTKEALTHAAHFLEEDGYKCRHCVPVAEFLSKLASGWVLVPGEPTPEILQAMHDGPLCASEYQMDEKAKAWLIDMYNAAIAAAPKP